MFIESFLIKIAAAVIKNALAPKLVALTTAFEIFTVFDAISDTVECVSTTNECQDLGVCALQVVSDPLAQTAVDHMLSLGETTFAIEETKSGLYIASRLAPRFAVPQLIIPNKFSSTELSHTQLVNRRLPHRRLS